MGYRHFKAARTVKANCACVSVVYLGVRIYMYHSMKVRSIICLRYKHKETLWRQQSKFSLSLLQLSVAKCRQIYSLVRWKKFYRAKQKQ